MTEQAGPVRPQRNPLDWAEPLPDAEVERALVVAAHPDDADFGSAGTLAGWVDAGIAVTLLLCTRGEQGGFDDTPRSEMPLIREREQQAASAALGVTDVRFLDGHSDGWLEPTWELQHQIVRVLRQVRPQRVLCQSPQRMLQRLQASHPDHLAAGEATVRAVYPASENRFAWPELLDEGLEPWKVTELWLMAHPDSPHVVDITDRFDRKVAALQAHASQTAHLGDGLEQMLRGWNEGNAARAGLAPGRLAESFAVSRIN
ncbi:MAG TPA: PIG-L deacetylase family protein [Friedmanniella sp.]